MNVARGRHACWQERHITDFSRVQNKKRGDLFDLDFASAI
jgi:hypothetical protein